MNRLSTLVAICSLACAPTVFASTPTFELEPCKPAGYSEEARCGTYEVFENRTTRKGRKIPLRVVVLPATGPDPKPDAVVFFAGGPGGSTVEMGAYLSATMTEARKERDFLFVDYRGTGESKPLFCAYQQENRGAAEALETFIPTDELEECRTTLSKDTDLSQYNTPNIVDDVDEVRAALGYPQVNLNGGSYGSRAALVYLRRHPEVVRTVVLEGVVPTDADMPETFARDAQAAFDGLVQECAEDAKCHAAFPDPAGDLRRVLAAIEKAAPVVPVVDGDSGETRQLRISRPVLVQTLRYMLYQVPASLQIPAFLHAAATGDFAPIAQTAYTVAGGLMAGLPDALYLSVTCAEDLPFIDPDASQAEAENTFLEDFRLKAQIDACKEWIRGEIPATYRQPVRSDKPVLIVSGERDPVTPVRWGLQAQRYLPNSRHLIVPDGAHSYFGLKGAECVDALATQLLREAKVEGLDLDACRNSISRRDFMLEIAKDETIELAESVLKKFVGSYASEEGYELTVEFDNGNLRAQAFGSNFAIHPLSETKFRPDGAPMGSYVVFNVDGKRVVSAQLEQVGQAPLVMLRKQ